MVPQDPDQRSTSTRNRVQEADAPCRGELCDPLGDEYTERIHRPEGGADGGAAETHGDDGQTGVKPRCCERSSNAGTNAISSSWVCIMTPPSAKTALATGMTMAPPVSKIPASNFSHDVLSVHSSGLTVFRVHGLNLD